MCDALVSGDVDSATEDFSTELRQHLGEVIALLPLPSSQATVESIEPGASGYSVVLRLVGETESVALKTRGRSATAGPRSSRRAT